MTEEKAAEGTTMTRGQLARLALVRVALALLALGAILFIPAGTFRFWHAWLWLAVLVIPMLAAVTFILFKDPALLERRMHTREREKPQSLLVKVALIWYVLSFIIPGLDFRFGWSSVPTVVVIAAAFLVFVGYVMILMVFRENSYASRVVEVAEKQVVIDTGPYAVVRHPMYLASIVLYAFTPLALGSYWAVLPMWLYIPIITILRIPNEEQVLRRELPGYEEYMQKVKYRLLPGVW